MAENTPATVVSGQLATAAQYNALQSGLNPLVENVYTSWALKSGFPLTVAIGTSNGPNLYWTSSVDEINDILYLDGSFNTFSMAIVDIANATPIASGATTLPSTALLLGDSYVVSVSPSAPQFSRNVRYYTWIDESNNIHIYKAGQSLSTIALPNPPFVPNTTKTVAAGYPIGPFMSPTGEYIIVWPYNGGTSNTIDLYVYEGQP